MIPLGGRGDGRHHSPERTDRGKRFGGREARGQAGKMKKFWILDFGLEESCARPAGNANIEHRTSNVEPKRSVALPGLLLGRLIAERKRNAEATEAAEMSAEADWVGEIFGNDGFGLVPWIQCSGWKPAYLLDKDFYRKRGAAA